MQNYLDIFSFNGNRKIVAKNIEKQIKKVALLNMVLFIDKSKKYDKVNNPSDIKAVQIIE